ncbi:MAG: hypothetical protein V4760_02355, partial [Bdellovibrionota bacterium]
MKVVGYIASDSLRLGFASHQIQNQSIQRFLLKRGATFLLSWTEYKGCAPMVLESLTREDFHDGICLYSLEQLGALANAPAVFRRLRENVGWIGFAREEIVCDSDESFAKAQELLWLQSNLMRSRGDLAMLAPFMSRP